MQMSRRHANLLLQILGCTIALMAIVALPVCHAAAFFPVTDADARTITESRDITEVVTTPGRHILHQGYSAVVECDDCDQLASANGHEPPSADDIGQRVATLPAGVLLAITPTPQLTVMRVLFDTSTTTSPDYPPPRTIV